MLEELWRIEPRVLIHQRVVAWSALREIFNIFSLVVFMELTLRVGPWGNELGRFARSHTLRS